MGKSKNGEEVFRIGTKVEVTFKEEGLKDSWYACRIIRRPRTSNKPPASKRHHYWVEYAELVEEDNHSQPLREYVDGSLIRPLPPTSLACTGNFEVFDVVEASHEDGWWVGVVVKVKDDGLKYCVLFQAPFEEIEFRRDQLRPHLRWLGGDRWIRLPKKFVEHRPLDGNKNVGSFQLPSEINTMIRTPSPAKELKLATSDDVEGSQSSGWTNVVQALEAPPLLNQSRQLSSSEGNLCSKRKMKAIQLQRNSMENDSKSCGKKRRVESKKKAVRRFLYSLLDGEEPQEPGTMHENTTDQSPTSDISGSHCISQTNELQVTEIVDEIIVIEEVVEKQVTERSPLPDEIRTSPHLATAVVNPMSPLSDEIRTSPFTKTSEMWKENKALSLYTNPILTQCSKPHPATVDVNPILDQSRTWPFTKRSEIWKAIESMEVFKSVPQMPHFSPLNEHKEDLREGIAICMMMQFAYEVERITSVSPDDLHRCNIILDILGNLKKLEPHGFSTTPLEVYLKALLEKMDRENELQVNLEEVESDVRKCQAEKAAAEREASELIEQMKSFQEQLQSAKSVKDLKEQQLSELESRKDLVSSELHHIRVTKKPFQW